MTIDLPFRDPIKTAASIETNSIETNPIDPIETNPIETVLRTVREELGQLLCHTNISLEVISTLLDVHQAEFKRTSSSLTSLSCYTSFPERCDRYWIPWTEYLGAWVTADGQKVILLVSEKADSSNLQGPLTTGLISVIAGACMNLQGQVAIHANAVKLGNYAIAFVGYSGMGKSTLSAYCATQGAGFITDDVLIVNRKGRVKSGILRLKLHPQAGKRLGLQSAQPTSYKNYYNPTQIGAVLPEKDVPLGILYFLAESSGQAIYSEPISPGQAVFNLLTHSYYAADLIPQNPDLLDSYIQVTAQAVVRQLFYPRDFALLSNVYDFLCKEVQDLQDSIILP